jgi:1-deoxy-D-xylulose-5-phosphate reductoisomerase
MGKKISIDSATMANKSLEVIEAHHLFDLPAKQIKILIHPQSIIHGIVNYSDGSSLAMMGIPDMQIPISYALNHPKRARLNNVDLDLAKIAKLDFIDLDLSRFPIVKSAYSALNQAQNAPCIFNAANEIAVDLFLQEKIKFTQIAQIIDQTLQKSKFHQLNSIQDVIDCSDMVKNQITEK